MKIFRNDVSRTIASGIMFVLLGCILPHLALGARLYFKDGDYIDGRRVYEKRGKIYLEVVRGTGGTLVYKSDEVDLGRTSGEIRKAEKSAVPNDEGEQGSGGQPLVFNDASTYGSENSSVKATPANDRESGRVSASAWEVTATPQVPSQAGVTVQIQGNGQVGYLRSITGLEKGAVADKNQDSTRYSGRIEKDGTALFTNNEGKTLRGYIGDDGVGSVMDENQRMIKVHPRQ